MSARRPGVRAAARRDDGLALVLVLLLIVIAGLLVIPLMMYATSVLRLNTAVSERSKDIEAAKGAMRIALQNSTASDVFDECDIEPGDPPYQLGSFTVNGTSVAVTCSELDEVGPLEAIGYQVSLGAIATQVGAAVPSTAIGGTAQGPGVPPYPDDSNCSGSDWSGCWWATQLPDDSVDGVELWQSVDGTIWMPELPRLPSTNRTDDEVPPYYYVDSVFDTPSGTECRVFFPGRYDQPLQLDGDAYYYFASGVYYFTEPITVGGDADVVVGMGREDFESRPMSERSYCADDLQVTAAFDDPVLKSIDNGGATWVFGGNARLVVDDSAGSPSIRFNQRYAPEDRGGRISIMSVNGAEAGSLVVPHDVKDVNYVRASRELVINENNGTFVLNDIATMPYTPSDIELTDAARLPMAPNVLVEGRKYVAATTERGALLVTWNEMTGNYSGGSVLDEADGFLVEYRRTSGPGSPTGWTPACDDPGDIVLREAAGPSGVDEHACYIVDLDLGRQYEVRVSAQNPLGWGPHGTAGGITPTAASTVVDAVPDAPTMVEMSETENDDEARIWWEPSSSLDRVPVTGYRATVMRHTGAAQPDEDPQIFGGDYVEVVGTTPVTRTIAAADANGGALRVEVVDTSGATGWTVTETTGLEVSITPPPTAPPPGGATASVQYVVYDEDDNPSDEATLTIFWTDVFAATDPDAKTFHVRPEAGVPLVVDLPVSDPQGDSLTLLPLSTGLAPPDWDIQQTGPTQITILTSVTDGADYAFTYDIQDGDGNTDPDGGAVLTIHAPTATVVDVGSCTFEADVWYHANDPSCVVTGVTDLDPLAGDAAFEARVEAISGAGESAPGTSALRTENFDGVTNSPVPAPAPPRYVTPWTPTPIIDIRAASPNTTTVQIAGYVAVPMGRIRIDNPEISTNDTIEIVGGVIAGTYDLVDPADDDTVIGFFNDIVLQRKVRITSTAGNVVSTAVVQINEDTSFRINSWVVR